MNPKRKSQTQTAAKARRDDALHTISIAQLIKWLDDAAEQYDYPEGGKEHSSARRVLDRVRLRICQRLYGEDFNTGYLFEHVDDAIKTLREER